MSLSRNDTSSVAPHDRFPSGVLLPVIPPDDLPERAPRSNAATAASAAGVRALSAQVVAFYFRAPAKAFFRTRVDYLGYARNVHNVQTARLFKAMAEDATGGRFSSLMRHTW